MNNKFHSCSHIESIKKFLCATRLGFLGALFLISLQLNAGWAQEGDSKTADYWIDQLASPNFATRQLATERLWTLGSEAKPLLQRIAKHQDPEISKRASDVLAVLDFDLDEDQLSKDMQLVQRFLNYENSTRYPVLQKLLQQNRMRLMFDLIASIDNFDEQADLLSSRSPFNINDILIRLAQQKRWDAFEYVLTHPITARHEPSAAVLYHQQLGSLDSFADHLKNTIETQEKANQTVTDQQWLRLIAIYRLQNRFDEIEPLVKKIDDRNLKDTLDRQLLFESGKWKTLAKKLAADGQGNPIGNLTDDTAFTVAQKAFVFDLVGDQENYQKIIDDLEAQAEQFAKQPEAEREIRNQLLQIGAATLNWPLVESNIDTSKKSSAFTIFSSNQRSVEAMEFVGLTDDVKQRNDWFRRYVRKIKSLKAKNKRLEDGNRGFGDGTSTGTQLRDVWQLCVQIAVILDGLGLGDEASYYIHQLFATTEDFNEKKQLLRLLIAFERFDEVWALVENNIDSAEYPGIMGELFPERSDLVTGLPVHAEFWYANLASRYRDPLQRLKVVSGLMNSPLGSVDNFDLESCLQEARGRNWTNPATAMDFYVAKIYEFHGNFEKSDAHLKLACAQDHDAAFNEATTRFFRRGDYKQVVALVASHQWNRRGDGVQARIVAECYKKLGDHKRATLLKCLSHAYWKSTYRRGNTFSFEQIEQLGLARDFLRLDTYDLDGNGVTNESTRRSLAQAEVELDLESAFLHQQLFLFSTLATQPRDNIWFGRLALIWSTARAELIFEQAKQNIRDGKYDDAVDLLLRINNYSPGDPSIGEEFMPTLDNAGASQHADRLFDELSKYFFDKLQRYPDSPLHRNNYAWLCACAKRKTEYMLRHVEVAHAAKPNTSSYLDTMAEIYFLLGDREKAIEFCRRCIEINSHKTHYRKQLKRFQTENSD